MTKTISLTQEKVAFVDDDDYLKLSKYRWFALDRGNGLWHACRNSRQRKGEKHTIYMHRQIINAPSKIIIDHINRNGLDNRKENLRTATKAENARNSVSRRGCQFKGIYFHKASHLWHARIVVNRKCISLGYFATPEDAAKAYDNAAIRYFKEFANLNFPKGASL